MQQSQHHSQCWKQCLKIFNGNAVKGRQRLPLNLCKVSKLPALQILLYPWEPNKSQGAWGGQMGGNTTTILFLTKRKTFCWRCGGSTRITGGPRWRFYTMFPALGAVLGLQHPVAGGVLRRGLKFQDWTNILNKFFKNFGNFCVLQRIILSGHWCDIIFLNVHAPSEEKSDDWKDNFYEEVGQVFDDFPKYGTSVRWF